MNFSRVRQRYFGVNKQNAHNAISSSLSERLDMRAKQNSGLLQSLHSFTSIPAVRSVVSGNLERWLQSPGLSGLARTLFTSTVKQIENVDPPLPADTEAIRKILSMRLKANQVCTFCVLAPQGWMLFFAFGILIFLVRLFNSFLRI